MPRCRRAGVSGLSRVQGPYKALKLDVQKFLCVLFFAMLMFWLPRRTPAVPGHAKQAHLRRWWRGGQAWWQGGPSEQALHSVRAAPGGGGLAAALLRVSVVVHVRAVVSGMRGARPSRRSTGRLFWCVDFLRLQWWWQRVCGGRALTALSFGAWQGLVVVPLVALRANHCARAARILLTVGGARLAWSQYEGRA